jgi:hypothetical protein
LTSVLVFKKIEDSRNFKRQQHETRRTVYVDIIEKLGDRRVDIIVTKDIVELVKSIVDHGVQVQARRNLS